MRIKIVIVSVALFLAGCGTFKHQQQTYYVKEVLTEGVSQPTPVLRVQVVPTVKSTHIPLFYHSRKWGGPYSITFSANSRTDVCTHFFLHSFRFTSNKSLIEEKQFSTPFDSFKFTEGRTVELRVKYERPDGSGVREILLNGIGEEKESSTSLFNAYMSV